MRMFQLFSRKSLILFALLPLMFGTSFADPAPLTGIPITKTPVPMTDQSMAAAATANSPRTNSQLGTNAPLLIPSPPELDVKGYVLFDVDSGKVLASKNADERMAPASLTKLMTIYLLFHALQTGETQLDSLVQVSKKAWQTGGSRMFLKVGQQVSVENLIHGIIVDSGNDACVAVSEYLAGSQNAFAQLMNQQAAALGMTNTHFTDATGLPHPDHYSTPGDLAKLARALQLNFPEYHQFFSKKWFAFNGIKQPNRNRLLWRAPYITGMKTGHTKAAGYCLIASADKDNMRLVAVVMGAPSDEARSSDAQALLSYGYRFFDTYKLYSAEQTIVDPRVWGGAEEKSALGVATDFSVTIPRNQYKNMKATVSLNSPLKAPLVTGQTYGTLTVHLGDKIVASTPLVALANNPKGGLMRRGSDKVQLFFHGLFSSKKANTESPVNV